MLIFSNTKKFFILAAVIMGIIFAIPNVLPSKTVESLPNFMQRTVNLGLDLQGGAHMLLEVDLSSAMTKAVDNERQNILDGFKSPERIRANVKAVNDKGYLDVVINNASQVETAFSVLREQSVLIEPGSLNTARTTRVEKLGEKSFRVTITPEKIEEIQKQTIEQSIEVLRRRIDPTGTTEMTLARQGSDRILLQIPGAKNINEIKDAIERTANLSFHLVDEDNSPAAQQFARENDGNAGPGKLYFPHRDGGGLIVQARTKITGACLQNSKPGIHPDTNEAIVNFTFNIQCAKEFGRMTSQNIGKPFAVVLDGTIITAPNIRSAITGGSGFIEGGFTQQSANQLSTLLNAGALPAKLIITEERTVGAELGEESINAGKIASMIGLAGVALFMWLSYGMRFGTIANLALSTNIILIAGALTLFGATLTLPGIAGIILTIGMAVDANVLIFERIREETHNGRPPVNAIETGYRRSLAPILDANITTLIAAVTLYFVGSGPVRGFAVTLAIGIVMSVFTAVVVARLMTASWLRGKRPKTLPI